MKLQSAAGVLVLLALLPAASGAVVPVEDTVEVAAGAFYQETVYPPSDGSAWSVRAEAINGTEPFDFYIMPTTELAAAYPTRDFKPMIERENIQVGSADFHAPSRLQSFTLVIDNVDNSRASDAVPVGNLTVRLLRTPPLRSNPEAQAALSAGATVCTAVLGVAAVGVAIYLKRRPRADLRGELDPEQERIEIDIPIPLPPRGAWAVIAPDDPPPEEAKK